MTHPNLIECIGIPAAGKTTITNAVIEELSARNGTANNPTDQINSLPKFIRLPTKLFYSGFAGVSCPFLSKDALATIYNSEQKSMLDLLSVSLNYTYLTGLVARTSPSEVTIMDQGIHQAIWSVGLRSQKSWTDIFDQFLPVPRTFQPDLLVIVQADENTVLKRLEQRTTTGSRIEPDAEYLEKTRTGMDILTERITSSSDFPVVEIRNEGDTDIDDIAEQLTNTILDAI